MNSTIFAQVEVEVIEDAYDKTSQGKMSKAFHGTEATVREEVGKYIQKITKLPKQLEREAEHEPHDAKEGASQLKDETQNGLRPSEVIRKGSPVTPEQDFNEREEDWHDIDDTDERNTGGAGPSSAALPSSVEKRSKSPKHKSIQRPVYSRVPAGKRRESFRRGVLGARARVQAPSPAPASTPRDSSLVKIEDDRQRQRGRDRHLSLSSLDSVTHPGSGTHTPHDSISRLRNDSLRAASPSRSIRFVDERPDEHPASGSQTPIVQLGGSVVDETHVRVAFDVPDLTPKRR